MAIDGRGYLDDEESGVRDAFGSGDGSGGGSKGRGSGKMVAPPAPAGVPLDRLMFQAATRHRFLGKDGQVIEVDAIIVTTRAWKDYKESRDPDWSAMPTPLGLTVAVRLCTSD